MAAPDQLPKITDPLVTREPSIHAVLGRNPVLARASAQGKVLAVAGKYWPCDHPVVVKAIETLAAARSEFAQPEFARPELAKETR